MADVSHPLDFGAKPKRENASKRYNQWDRPGARSALHFNHEGETVMAGQTGHGRRAFLRGTLAAGAACFGTGLKEALAQAKAAGKPLLTVDNLNSLIDTHYYNWCNSYHILITLSNYNHIAFLQTHFHVIDKQLDELKQFTPNQVETIEFFMELARKHGHKLQIGILPPIVPHPPAPAVSFESSSGDHFSARGIPDATACFRGGVCHGC